jgi:hypothetical protein
VAKGTQASTFANRFYRERASVMYLLRSETLLAGISERSLQCATGRVKISGELGSGLYARSQGACHGKQGGRGRRGTRENKAVAYRRPCRLYAAREHEWVNREIWALELLLGTMLAVIILSGIESGICRNLFAATGLADIVLCGSVYSARVPLPGINHFEQGHCEGQAVVVPEPVVQSEANCSCKHCVSMIFDTYPSFRASHHVSDIRTKEPEYGYSGGMTSCQCLERRYLARMQS